MKPSWGKELAQRILYLLAFFQLGLGHLLREIKLTQGLASRSFLKEGGIG